MPVYYPACPHYPRSWVHNHIYTRLPFLDSQLLWPWCRSAVDQIMREHPFDVVHTNFLFPSGYLGLKIKERFGTPFIAHERSIQRMGHAKQYSARGRKYRYILRNSDLVITENSNMAAELRTLEPEIPDVEVILQPGTHPDRVESQRRERPAEYAGKLVVLSVGTLSVRKGHAYLIKAVAQLRSEFPNLLCRIIGGGPEHEHLEALVRELGVEDMVELRGKRPHAEVLGDMSWCDVFVLASWGEASGTVYGEAMQFCKPAIACTDEGITEVMRDREHGRLVPARDAAALADALRWLLVDEERRNMVGEQARALADEKLSYSRVAQRLIGIYEGLSDAARKRNADRGATPTQSDRPVQPVDAHGSDR